MVKFQSQIVCLCLFLLGAVASSIAQGLGFSLVFQRASLGAQDLFARATIRSDSRDSYLLLAPVAPRRLLRSYDRGDSFEYACSPGDYLTVEDYSALMLWDDDRSAITGISRGNVLGALASSSRFINFSSSVNKPSDATPDVRTYQSGIAVIQGDYTLDGGASWRRFKQSMSQVIYDRTWGFVGIGKQGDWCSYNVDTDEFKTLRMIPSRYRYVRSTSGGTLIGFTDSTIGWLRPGDTTLVERKRFSVPGVADAVPLQIVSPVTWRGNMFFCLAINGDSWYLLSIGEDSVRIQHLKPSKGRGSFLLGSFDEPGFLITECDDIGRPGQIFLYNRNGVLVCRPEIQRHIDFPRRAYTTWSDSATYVFEVQSGDPNPCHLYRIDHATPDRVEHVGRVFTGDAESVYQPMGVCVLDTLNGSLVGRDARGALHEYTTDGEMRGFLIYGRAGIPPQQTAELNIEHSVPQLITTDSVFVIGTDIASIGVSSGQMYGWIWNRMNPLTMLQRASDRTFYFGRRDIIHASYDGVPLDTIEVALPGENRDSVGALSDIVEVDKQKLVVALRGYNKRTYYGDPLLTVRGGIAYTTDRGATWKRSSVPTLDQAYYSMEQMRSGTLLSVSVDVAILSDSATKSSAVQCYSGTILRSTDEGATWTTQATFRLRNPELTRCSYRIWQGNQRIAIATPEALMISTDDGETWTEEINFPAICVINGVAEYKGQLYVATSLGIYRENTSTSVGSRETRAEPTIHARASHSGQAWRITVTGLPTARIYGVDVYDIQGRQHPTEHLWSQEGTASVTSPLPNHGVYGVVVHGPNGQRWTATVGVYE
jgi:hypothetical protein